LQKSDAPARRQSRRTTEDSPISQAIAVARLSSLTIPADAGWLSSLLISTGPNCGNLKALTKGRIASPINASASMLGTHVRIAGEYRGLSPYEIALAAVSRYRLSQMTNFS
jgi:hypothetical protein